MKDNFIHVAFVVDSSGSMYSSAEDVVGGFKSIVDEQKKVEGGQCAISLFTFADNVKECYVGKDVKEVDEIDYKPCGCTALNDGVGTAIDRIGKWLSDMGESERPSKNLIVIMTDGMENSSCEYSLERVKEMIKHQTEKYSWEFMYIGADVTTLADAKSLGISKMSFTSKKNIQKSYDMVNCATALYRNTDASVAENSMSDYLLKASLDLTNEYEAEIGAKIQ